MGVLSTDAIQAFRDLNTELAYHDWCEVLRDGDPVRGPSGDFITVEEIVATQVPCSLDEIAAQGQERVVADRLGYEQPYQIGVPYELEINRADRVRMLDSGRTFEVGEILKGGQLGIELVLIVQEIG